MSIRLCDLVIAQEKSKIKAGEGKREGDYKFFTSSNIQTKYVDFFQYDKPALIFGTGGMPSIHYCDEPFSTSTDCIVFYAKNNRYSLKSLYLFFESHMNLLEEGFHGAGLQHISKKYLLDIQIPDIPIEQQLKINNIGDKLNRLIDIRKNQLENYNSIVKSRFIEMFGDPILNDKKFPTILGKDYFKLSNGKAVVEEKRITSGIPAYGGNGISWFTDKILFKTDTLVFGRVGFQSGNVHLAKGPLWVTDNAMYISDFFVKDYNLIFLYALMVCIDFTKYQDAGDLKKITQKPFMKTAFILPPIELQKEFELFVQHTDKSKLAIEKSIKKLEILKKSLMQEYFG